MSRVRIEVFDGDFEDAPSYTRESTVECEGDDLRAAFERAVAMARAALPAEFCDSVEVFGDVGHHCNLPAGHAELHLNRASGRRWPHG